MTRRRAPHKVLTPDTAHGTNPATVTMAGYEVRKVGTDADGGVDLEDLRAKADEDVACLMLTNPNTLGVFDPNIEEIASHRPRGRRDALLRRREPQRGHGQLAARRHGLRHRPLQPPQVVHAAARRRRSRRRPDRGLRPHRALHAEARWSGARTPDGPASTSTSDRPQSIGRLRGFQGNYGVFVRSYAYIRSLGAEGLRDATETAVLNANYLLARLRELCGDDLPLAFGERCMHEFVLSATPLKKETGVKTLDLAKRLLDHGFHPPTVYFPLLVDEALLIEPTETETKETLDAFADGARRDRARGQGRPGARPERAVLRRRCAGSTRPAAAKRPGAFASPL